VPSYSTDELLYPSMPTQNAAIEICEVQLTEAGVGLQ
jgi:hypothetical protein